jgi:hypothetical protein
MLNVNNNELVLFGGGSIALLASCLPLADRRGVKVVEVTRPNMLHVCQALGSAALAFAQVDVPPLESRLIDMAGACILAGAITLPPF